MTLQRLTLLVVLVATAGLLVSLTLIGGTAASSTAFGADPWSRLGEMPTRDNTGPNEPLTGGDITAKQFFKTRVCDHQRVVGKVRIQLATDRPGTWTLAANQCEFTGAIHVEIYGDYPASEYPTISLHRVSVLKGIVATAGIRINISESLIGEAFLAPCPSCAGEDWNLRRAMPLEVTDTLFYSDPPSKPDGFHHEALHLMGSATDVSFDNVRFVILGPMVTEVQTGAILADADQATFENVYFDFGDGPLASYATAYIGRGSDTAPGAVRVRGCRIQKGHATYIFPNGTGNHNSTAASWSGCRDWDTGEPLTLGRDTG